MEWYNIAQEGQGTAAERKRGSGAAHQQSQSWRWTGTTLAAGKVWDLFWSHRAEPQGEAALAQLSLGTFDLKKNQSGTPIQVIFLETHSKFLASVFSARWDNSDPRLIKALQKSLNVAPFLICILQQLNILPEKELECKTTVPPSPGQGELLWFGTNLKIPLKTFLQCTFIL